MTQPQAVTFVVQRCSEDAAGEQEYRVPIRPGMTVLDGLLLIQKTLDATLAWRFSCRMGICGSCAMVMNGRPGLACNTQISDVDDAVIRLAPLPNFRVIKDLAVDLHPMLEKHRTLKPFILSDPAVSENETPAGDDGCEYVQSPEELLEFLQFSDCIKCGACMAVCPTVALDPLFPGPMPLAALHRYNADTRDAGFRQRREALKEFHDPGHCHYAAECSQVCPKGVDPARAIQLLKRSLVVDSFGLRRSGSEPDRRPAGTADAAKKIPAPDYTVDSGG